MARYVVIRFEDNKAAEDFVDQQKAADGVFGDQETVALIPAPTLFCEDPFSQHGNKKAGYFRGKKYGWWVCSICGKPSRLWGSNYRAVVGAGKNLLEETTDYPPPGFDQDSSSRVA